MLRYEYILTNDLLFWLSESVLVGIFRNVTVKSLQCALWWNVHGKVDLLLAGIWIECKPSLREQPSRHVQIAHLEMYKLHRQTVDVRTALAQVNTFRIVYSTNPETFVADMWRGLSSRQNFLRGGGCRIVTDFSIMINEAEFDWSHQS